MKAIDTIVTARTKRPINFIDILGNTEASGAYFNCAHIWGRLEIGDVSLDKPIPLG
jgi:hypothetical protein